MIILGDCNVAVMDREWMYRVPRIDDTMSFVNNVQKFIDTAKKHRLSLGRELTYCPCSRCENKLLLEDNGVKSHLIRYGFVKDYTIWKFHGEEAGPSSTEGASAVEDGGQPPSSTAAAGGDSANRDYIHINELLDDIAMGDDGDDEAEYVLQPVAFLQTPGCPQ